MNNPPKAISWGVWILFIFFLSLLNIWENKCYSHKICTISPFDLFFQKLIKIEEMEEIDEKGNGEDPFPFRLCLLPAVNTSLIVMVLFRSKGVLQLHVEFLRDHSERVFFCLCFQIRFMLCGARWASGDSIRNPDSLESWFKNFCGRIWFTQVAINLLKNGCAKVHPCLGLVHNILWFLSVGGSFSWSHTLRECNQVVDALAGHAQSLRIGFLFFMLFLLFLFIPFWHM